MSLQNWNPHGGANRYSAKNTSRSINFFCNAPDAQKVTIIGDFNDWHPEATPMKKHLDGSWQLQLTLPHGHHHYQFLIDGKPTLDPKAQGIARNEKNEKVSLIAVS